MRRLPSCCTYFLLEIVLYKFSHEAGMATRGISRGGTDTDCFSGGPL